MSALAHISSTTSYDFMFYWVPFQLLLEGKNPYDIETFNQALISYGFMEPGISTVFKYPPWVLVTLAPLLLLPYATAVGIWFFCSIAFLIATIFFTWKTFSEETLRPKTLLALAFFIPAFEVLSWGQSGLLVTFILSVAIWAIAKKKDRLAGAILPLAMLKPHLLVIVCLAILWLALLEKRYQILQFGILSMSVIIALGELAHPGLTNNWLEIFADANKHGDTYFNAVPADWLILGIKSLGYNSPSLELINWLALGLGAIFLSYLMLKRKPFSNSLDYFPLAILLSIICAPYGWMHDQCLLMITCVAIVASQPKALKACLGIQTLALLFHIFGPGTQHHWAWLPLAISMLWYCLAFKQAKN